MRVSWERYYMNIAAQVATRATCDRKHVGSVIVSVDNTIIATGYNGSVKGSPHCDDVGHMMEDGHCTRTVHSEINAITQAARNGVKLNGSTLYCTALPCWPCFKQICNSGIEYVIYDEEYRVSEHIGRVLEHAAYAGVIIRRLNEQDVLVDPGE